LKLTKIRELFAPLIFYSGTDYQPKPYAAHKQQTALDEQMYFFSFEDSSFEQIYDYEYAHSHKQQSKDTEYGIDCIQIHYRKICIV